MDWIAKIKQYSTHIAGSRAEAEDLAHDSYVKIIAAIRQDPDKPLTNAFLYRVALNTWKDKLRKRRLDTVPFDAAAGPSALDTSFSTRELLELLADSLPPRMAVILLLMDVFDFTAKETAALIASKEATVQVTLGRARTRLKQAAMQASFDSAQTGKRKPAGNGALDFEALVDAFRRRNPQAIYKAYIGLSRNGVQIQRIRRFDDSLSVTFRDPDGNVFTVIA